MEVKELSKIINVNDESFACALEAEKRIAAVDAVKVLSSMG